MRRFEVYRVREGTDLGDPNTLNTVFDDVDIRLASIEETKRSWDEQVQVLVELGLARVNEVLLPAVERITRLANLGALFSARSLTEFVPVPGRAVFVVEASKREAFAPAWYLSITSESDTTIAMAATLVSYDEVSGELIVDVVRAQGGVAADWYIAPGSATEALDILHASEQARDAAKASAETAGQHRAAVTEARDDTERLHESVVASRNDVVDARVVVVNARDIVIGARDTTLSSLATVQGLAASVNTRHGEVVAARDATTGARATTLAARDQVVGLQQRVVQDAETAQVALDGATDVLERVEQALATTEAARDQSVAIKAAVTTTAGEVVGARDETLAALEAFPRWYLGAFESDPSQGPAGILLEEGMLYSNTTHRQVRQYYAATGWTAVYIPADTTVGSVFGRTGPVGAMLGDYHSGLIARTNGQNGIAGATVEAALAAVWTAKADAGHAHANATTSAPGFMSGEDKTKINGIAAGATKNDTDANLKNRANHSGVAPMSSIDGLQTALAGKADDLHGHAWGDIGGTPVTLAGYGIGDAYAKSDIDTLLSGFWGKSELPASTVGKAVLNAADGPAARTAIGAQGALSTIAQAEAEAGESVITRNWNAQRVRQAIAAFAVPLTKIFGIADISGLSDALNSKSNDGHKHAFAELTTKPTSLAGYGIGDAYTKTTADTLLSDKISVGAVTAWVRSNLFGAGSQAEARTAIGLGSAATAAAGAFAPSAHDHDGRYYQKPEIDTQMSGKVSTHANVTALIALAATPNRGIYFDAEGVLTHFTLSAAGRQLIDDADAAAQRVTLGAAGLKERGQLIEGGAGVKPMDPVYLAGATITLDPGDRPTQVVVNNGAGPIQPGTVDGTFMLWIVNAAGAGSITTTGFTVKGDSFDTAMASKFLCSVHIDTLRGSVLSILKVA
jgi:hypothetical protein